MAARKKRAKKRTRTGSARAGSVAAWKRAELRLAKYFGVERTGLGRKGHDLSEAPEVKGWLRFVAPELVDSEPEAFTHICADSKCDKNLISLLQRWHEHVLHLPDKYLIPLGIMGPIKAMDNGGGPYLIGMVRLKDFALAYRALLSPRWEFELSMLQILHRFHIWRYPKEPGAFLQSAFEQVELAAFEWSAKQLKDYEVRPLELVYASYPKRMADAVLFKFPQY